MTLVDISNVKVYKVSSEKLWGYHIDAPASGSQSEVYAFDISGWVLGRSSETVTAVEVVHNGTVIEHAHVGDHRSDLAAVYPDVVHAERSGFHTSVSVLAMRAEIQLFVRVVLIDNSRVDIGVIQAQRRPLRSRFEANLQPLMLTNLGRSGSTWLTHLLGQHPQIVTYQPFKYEPRVASYWMEVLNTLSRPESYLQSILTEGSGPYWWIGDENASPLPLLQRFDPTMHQWLGRNSIEEIASFCQSRIDEFYEQVRHIQGKGETSYFAERFYGTSHFAMIVMWELYPQTRQIVLVRDLRDMLCSMLAFNEKTDLTMFGRELVNSDQDFVYQIGLLYKGLLRTWKENTHKVHLLRYEDLTLRPEETLTSAVEYLGVNSDSTTIRQTLHTAMDTATELQHGHMTSANLTASIGRWRRDLDPSLQAVCQEAFGDVLEEFGYAKY